MGEIQNASLVLVITLFTVARFSIPVFVYFEKNDRSLQSNNDFE